MGLYDTVFVPCPKCGEKHGAQSKSGDCSLAEYQLQDAPFDVLINVNRHAPFTCIKCNTVFYVKFKTVPQIVLYTGTDNDSTENI